MSTKVKHVVWLFNLRFFDNLFMVSVRHSTSVERVKVKQKISGKVFLTSSELYRWGVRSSVFTCEQLLRKLNLLFRQQKRSGNFPVCWVKLSRNRRRIHFHLIGFEWFKEVFFHQLNIYSKTFPRSFLLRSIKGQSFHALTSEKLFPANFTQ